jgi:hypothetical protein
MKSLNISTYLLFQMNIDSDAEPTKIKSSSVKQSDLPLQERVKRTIGKNIIKITRSAYSGMYDLFPDPVLPEQYVWALREQNPGEHARLCTLSHSKGPIHFFFREGFGVPTYLAFRREQNYG